MSLTQIPRGVTARNLQSSNTEWCHAEDSSPQAAEGHDNLNNISHKKKPRAECRDKINNVVGFFCLGLVGKGGRTVGSWVTTL